MSQDELFDRNLSGLFSDGVRNPNDPGNSITPPHQEAGFDSTAMRKEPAEHEMVPQNAPVLQEQTPDNDDDDDLMIITELDFFSSHPTKKRKVSETTRASAYESAQFSTNSGGSNAQAWSGPAEATQRPTTVPTSGYTAHALGSGANPDANLDTCRSMGQLPVASAEPNPSHTRPNGTAMRAIGPAELHYRLSSASEAERALLKSIKAANSKCPSVLNERAKEIRKISDKEAASLLHTEHPAVLDDRAKMAKNAEVRILDKAICAAQSFLTGLIQSKNAILGDFEGWDYMNPQPREETPIHTSSTYQQAPKASDVDQDDEESTATLNDVDVSGAAVKAEPQDDEEVEQTMSPRKASEAMIKREFEDEQMVTGQVSAFGKNSTFIEAGVAGRKLDACSDQQAVADHGATTAGNHGEHQEDGNTRLRDHLMNSGGDTDSVISGGI